jgi:type IV pilus assembly protein PilM
MLTYLKQFAFGIDICSSAVSILKLAKKRKGLVLDGFHRASLPVGLIRAGRIQDENYLSEIIKKAAGASRPRPIKDVFVNLALPEQISFLQITQLPEMSFEEARSAIKWEIEANIPLPMESVYYDWRVLKSARKIDHLDILIAAAPKDAAESYIRTAKRAGFYPKSVEIDSFSLCRSLVSSFYSREPVLIVELSSVQATLAVFSGNALRFSSTIPLSGRHFAEMADFEWDPVRKIKVKKITADSPSKIEENRKSSDAESELDDKTEDKKNIPIFAAFLTEQLRSYLEFYESHAEHDHQSESPQIKKIILCGSGIFVGFDRLLTEKLGVKVEIGNPFVNISKNPQADFPLISIEESLALTKVIGLAVKDYVA